MSSFDDRKKSFEKKFANDQELQFKLSAKRNKYLGSWAAQMLKKNMEETEIYIKEVIKSDFKEPGDKDVIKKIKIDFDKAKKLLNYSPKFSLQKGLKESVKWYWENLKI